MAQKLQEVRDQLNRSLRDTSKPWASILGSAEQKTGLDRLYIFIGGIAVIAYMSIHAIESHNKEDDTKWLTYWVVFAIFSIVEYFADIIVGWFPLYWLIKCIFMVWLMIPTEFNGSLVIYKRIVRPYFLKHHGVIDDTLNKMKEQVNKVTEKTN
ncbi:hypothetical protein GWI33_022076 [Rhynchophorus ferrugineus]|uniref:Receptor expression-enhancing protein n=1 Tax=Rhynchophorus ferrugineus TaxID=354439 RepID=A0A834INQ8_RHYFE|nr:hypothetical protein GWI33_022076 [Rhynchophorus ferrugineus]